MKIFSCIAALVLFVACGAPVAPGVDAGDELDASQPFDAGSPDAAAGDAGAPDAAVGDAGGADGGSEEAGLDSGTPGDGGVTLVNVSHQRELRGVWLATVANLDWPSSQSLSPDAGRASLESMVERLADAGINAVFFQVRPESDALYASTIEPWSRFLTGTQGRNPGWDPLAVLLDYAHARGVEVHAWVNPYRALVSSSSMTAANHVSRTLAADAIVYNGATVMNPGSAAVRAYVVSVMRDLLDHYDVDGLHFDDYFYPYPDASNTPFPDTANYNAYVADGGTLTRLDWRRENVNALVAEVMNVVKTQHPNVRFGISPFGIYKPGTPPGIVGLNAYDTLACDSVRWMNEGWVDYLAPQLYWPTTPAAQSYTTLATWWAQGTMGGRHLFPGHGTYRLGTTSAWTLSEYRTQLNVTRGLRANNALGDLHFRTADVLSNRSGVLDLLRSEFYSAPALPPPVPRAGAAMTPPVPFVARAGQVLTVTNPLPMTVRFYALYREAMPGQWALTKVAGGASVQFAVTSGTWAVSAIGRGDAESQGVLVVVP